MLTSAPAQQVVITENLDPSLDWSTFAWGDFGFGSHAISVPAGRRSFQTRVDDRATTGVYVDVSGDINLTTGELTWTFTSIDPATGDLPADLGIGFLPPDVTAPQGDGWISYSVWPKADSTTGTKINAEAAIVFDTNDPVPTPAIYNTIDAGGPSSSVTALPAYSQPSFTVSWAGQDDADGKSGAGVASYDIYVSDNRGTFQPWLPGTTETSATYTGQEGHTYGFYSVATDNVGHREPTPSGAQATTIVRTQVSTTTTLASDCPAGSVYGQPVTFTATVSADGAGGIMPTGFVQFTIDGGNFGQAVALEGGSACVAVASLAPGSHHVVAIYTSDTAGFAGSTSPDLTQTVSPARTTVLLVSRQNRPRRQRSGTRGHSRRVGHAAADRHTDRQPRQRRRPQWHESAEERCDSFRRSGAGRLLRRAGSRLVPGLRHRFRARPQ